MGKYGPSTPKTPRKRCKREDIREACIELDPHPQDIQPPDHPYADTIKCKLEKDCADSASGSTVSHNKQYGSVHSVG
ncbi:hypothetical protein PoB_005103700 [Plakobranchus ocellatus]|uniref:Uncharacterized protein n=1 Tax=Plakobranchus ocellatus TaxID=259542 RepID=A0AAV4BZK5_9GAST|nr:hypothetical protein PoB_005103700 [Plakobranchus ocellatus]